MRDNKLTIQINRPVKDIWEFTLNPKNTSKWIGYVDFEKTNEWPVKVGTIYENGSKKGQVFTFRVTEYALYECFELAEVNSSSNYRCRYTFRKINEDSTELEYYEWVESGELHYPFAQRTLEKLKKVMENN